MKNFFLLVLVAMSLTIIAQPGKDGALTVSTPNYVVNRYIPVTQNIASGSNSFVIAVGNPAGICAGDLVMIYLSQGSGFSFGNFATYGQHSGYHAGLYEFKYIQSVNGNTVTTQTAFTNAFLISGGALKVQMIKVPQYTTLTINPGASISARAWKDTTIATTPYRFGGLVVIHATNIINNGSIVASGSGYRGGQANNNTAYPYGTTSYLSISMGDGGEKGEGVAGSQSDYDISGGRYCRGAPANGGGGGNSVNSSGGGGGNGFNGNTWNGQGVMIVNTGNLVAAWALDPGYIANSNALTNSSGGGRGGYSWGSAPNNPTVTAPGNPTWLGDARREVGGLGGRPLTDIDSESRIYFGGGGGGGHTNNTTLGSAGSNGGGIVYLIATNGITGSGLIESNGIDCTNSLGCPSGCDGVGGAGAGGSIVIKTGAIASTQTVSAIGGKGASQLTPPSGNETEGAGGGGGGGFAAISATGVSPNINGGLNGITVASFLNTMTSNGATQGATGQTSTVSANFISFTPIVSTFSVSNNSPICAGATLTLTTNMPGPYSWTGPNSFTSAAQNPTIVNASPVASGVYFLGAPGSACSIGATTVIVAPQPTVTIFNVTGSQSITCTSPTVDLAAVSSYTNLNYFWTSNTFTANTQTVTVVSANTLITLTSVDPVTGCSASATTAIQVNTTVPITTVGPLNQLINCGPGVVATATGVAVTPSINVTHYWYFPCNPLPQISGGQNSIASPVICTDANGLTNGTSTFVVVNNINGCSTTKTVQVVSTGGNFPSFSVTSFSSTNQFTLGCSTKSVTDVNIVNGQTNPTGGAISYTMLVPPFSGTSYTTSTVSVYTVNTPGTYTVIVKDNVNQCETRVYLPIIQNTFSPVIMANAITRTLSCDVPSVSLIGSSSTPNVTYLWKTNSNPPTFPNPTITVSTNTAGASVNSATVIDNFTLTIRDEGNLCLSNTVVTMYQNTRPPKANIALSNPALTCIIFSVNLSNNSSTGILPGTFFVTQNVVATLWQGPSPQQDLTNSSTYLGYTAGIYTMTAKDLNNGCSTKTTAVVGDNRVYPVLSTNSVVALDCGASATGGVKLAVTAINLAPAAITSLWETPLPTPNVSGLTTLTLTTDGVGEYTLTVTTNSNGCATTTTVNVVNGVLTASFTAEETSGYAPLTVNFTNNTASSSTLTGTQNITAVWSFGNGTTKTTTVNTISAPTSAIYSQPGTYTVTMFATKGSCIDTFMKVIRVDIPSKLEVPNVFTPNGDNSNDIFFVKTANLSEITALIYDRWGNKIYELTTGKGNIAWDGKTNIGTEAPDGTYFYIITAKGKDGQTYDKKGTVSLYR